MLDHTLLQIKEGPVSYERNTLSLSQRDGWLTSGLCAEEPVSYEALQIY